MEMDFTLLYNPQRRLFSVGFNLEDGRLDRAHYDMLASEARIASLVAIAKGDTEHRHWFQLGRARDRNAPRPRGLLSWGGTMFEYLMPTLFSRYVAGSLLERSCDAAVERQIAYGRQRRVPWGISESAFAAQAANGDYHYQSFGVPGLGLKRGLGKDLVISPYSTALALPVRPAQRSPISATWPNEGAEGPWGFYDAVDYTPERVPDGERRVVVYSLHGAPPGHVMAALATVLRDHCVQRRFQRQPLMRSTDLLLQERIPVAVLAFQSAGRATVTVPSMPVQPGPVSRRISTPHTVRPRGAFAFQWPVQRDGHELRRRLQPLSRPRHHPLASRHNARRLGAIRLPARPGNEQSLVGHPSSDSHGGRHLRSHVFHRQSRVSSPRRKPGNSLGSHHLAGDATPRSAR